MIRLKQLTPNLIVPAIEPCLAFWRDRLGFAVTAEVPHGNGLGFVILEKDDVRLMLQTRASVQDDAEVVLENEMGPVNLFVVVANLEEVERALEGIEPALARRTTFYGMKETGYRDPAGNFVLFAERIEGQAG